MEYISPEGLRLDGRRPKELRQLSCQFGILAKADGSATFEMGNTKVLAAVFGPHEVEQRSKAQPGRAIVQCEYAMAAFSTGERRKRGKTDRRSTELSTIIRNCLEQTILLELMPSSQIDVYVQVLQADGGTRCACINAAMLAIAEAGIPVRDLMAACAAGYLDSTSILDMNYMEDSGGGPDVAVAIHPNLNKTVLLQMDNKIAVDVFEGVYGLAEQGCKAVAQYMRQQLLAHVQRLAVMRGPTRL